MLPNKKYTIVIPIIHFVSMVIIKIVLSGKITISKSNKNSIRICFRMSVYARVLLAGTITNKWEERRTGKNANGDEFQLAACLSRQYEWFYSGTINITCGEEFKNNGSVKNGQYFEKLVCTGITVIILFKMDSKPKLSLISAWYTKSNWDVLFTLRLNFPCWCVTVVSGPRNPSQQRKKFR